MMRFTVSEMARQTGVSVRTLHYYDHIGLLMPAIVADTGYRYYDETSLERLQQILFYRELEFPLKEIKRIMSLPAYDRFQALRGQRELLVLKKKRMEGLIGLVERTLKGEKAVGFKEFDMSEIESAKLQYEAEIKTRWGSTDSYQESSRKTKEYDREQWDRITKEAETIFGKFAFCNQNHIPCDDLKAQELVKEWQDHISRWYYNCTEDILEGLGAMYAEDERFAQHIDQSGAGTAGYMSEAIRKYIRK